MATHEIKCWPTYFEAIESGEKTFEVRRDDRGYQKGDVLVLYKYDPAKGYLRHRVTHEAITVRRRITWVLTGGQFGIEPGHVVLALKDETGDG